MSPHCTYILVVRKGFGGVWVITVFSEKIINLASIDMGVPPLVSKIKMVEFEVCDEGAFSRFHGGLGACWVLIL